MKLRTFLCCCGILWAANVVAADFTIPHDTVAGEKLSIATSGSGDANILVIGPGHIVSRKTVLGRSVELTGEDIADAGRYLVILSAGDADISKSFVVSPARPAHLSFVAHPSRAPVSQKNEITGTVYVFDVYNNLIPSSMTVDFKLAGAKAGALERQVESRNGIAAVSMDSPRLEGSLTFQAATGDVHATRIVRVVADEPCTLQIHGVPSNKGVKVQTDPVKDCSGNPVPDGTLVTFTAWDAQGRSTVDTSVKKGIATVELPTSGEVRVSAASGVALGKEILLRSAQ